MKASIRKLYSALRLYRLGIVDIVLNRLLTNIARLKTVIVYNLDINKGRISPQATNKEITYHKIGAPEGELFDLFYEQYPRQEFISRLEKKSKDLYIAMDQDRVVGYAWITYNVFYMDEVNYTYPLRKDELFIYDCFVTTERRGEGIYPDMLRQILSDYSRDDNYGIAYIAVATANAGSIRGIEKAGFKEHNRVKYFRWLGREKWWGVERTASSAEAAEPVMK